MSKLILGPTINTTHGFVSSAEYAKSLGASVYQIFLGSPQTYKCKRRSNMELIQLNNKLKENNLKIVIHASYMLNFCNHVNSFQHKEAIRLLVGDLTDSSKLNCIGVVVHMGKKLNMEENVAIDNYVMGIKTVLKQTPQNSIIIFETGAGVGTEICTSLYNLGKLYKKFTIIERKRIRFCIDTCHVFSAGYSINNLSYVDLFCELIDIHLGWNNIACIHLNDSKCQVNSKKDRHADIGCGLIGSDGLKKFVQVCVEKVIPIILETPCENNFTKDKQIALIKSWI